MPTTVTVRPPAGSTPSEIAELDNAQFERLGTRSQPLYARSGQVNRLSNDFARALALIRRPAAGEYAAPGPFGE